MTMDIFSTFLILFAVFQNVATEFICTREGRLTNSDDTTSRSYYLCRKLRNGTYISKLYQCPSSTYFNPETELCTTDYIPESPTPDFQCSQRGRFPDTTDENCQRYYLCSILHNGTFVKTVYFCPNASCFDPSLGQCSADYRCPTKTTTTTDVPMEFVCRKKGRFKDPEDMTCTIYYLCSQLRDGSFIRTKYKCPKGSFFDPEKEKCTVNYICHEGSVSNSSTLRTTPFPLTTISSATGTSANNNIPHDDRDSTPNAINTSTSTDGTGTVTSTSINTITPADIIFTDGGNSSTSSIAVPTSFEDDFTCTEKGRFPDPSDVTCKIYFLCSELRNGNYIKTKYLCPQNSRFDPEAAVCSTFYTCPRSTTENKGTTQKSCRRIKKGPRVGKSASFACNDKGRFRDPDDYTCKLYYLCSRLHNGTIVSTKYRCPEGSGFDPELGRCSAVYVCPGSTAAPTETEDCEGSGDDDYSEETEGTEWPDETTIYTNSDEEDTSGRTSATTERYTSTGSEDDFVCSNKGRFADVTDVNCKKYFLCSQLNNGTYIKTKYKCPSSTYFDPYLEKCSSVYQCSHGSSTTNSFEYSDYSDSDESCCTAEILTPTFDSKETSVTWISSGGTGGYSQTTLALNFFICTEKGRFSDPADTACGVYFLCSQLNNGSFIATKFQCPSNTYFNPTLQICSREYQCPYQPTPSMEYDSSEVSTEEESLYTDGDDDYSLLTTRFGMSSPAFISSTSSVFKNTENPLETTIKEVDLTKPSDEGGRTKRMTDEGVSYNTTHFKNSSPVVSVTSRTDTTITERNLTTEEDDMNTDDDDDGISHNTKHLENSGTLVTEININTTSTYNTFPTSNNKDGLSTKELEPMNTDDNSDVSYNTIPTDISTDAASCNNTNTNTTITISDSDILTTLIDASKDTSTEHNVQILTTTNRWDDYNITNMYTEVPNITTTDIIIGHTVSKYFACKARGYYKNYEDPSGVSYYYCDIASDGKLFQYLLKCPNAYFYNTENNLCTPIETKLLAN